MGVSGQAAAVECASGPAKGTSSRAVRRMCENGQGRVGMGRGVDTGSLQAPRPPSFAHSEGVSVRLMSLVRHADWRGG